MYVKSSSGAFPGGNTSAHNNGNFYNKNGPTLRFTAIEDPEQEKAREKT